MADTDPRLRAKNAGLDASGLSDEHIKALDKLSDEELKQLAQIKRKLGEAAPLGVNGGLVF